MSFTPIPFESLQYLHPTSHDPPRIEDEKCVLKTASGTDWWHTTDRDSQDGLAYGKWVQVGDGFEVRVKASIEVKERVRQVLVIKLMFLVVGRPSLSFCRWDPLRSELME
jgi:hypothetical protein